MGRGEESTERRGEESTGRHWRMRACLEEAERMRKCASPRFISKMNRQKPPALSCQDAGDSSSSIQRVCHSVFPKRLTLKIKSLIVWW